MNTKTTPEARTKNKSVVCSALRALAVSVTTLV